MAPPADGSNPNPQLPRSPRRKITANVPYFLYRLRRPRPPEKAGSFKVYREARTAAREMRRTPDRGDPTVVRIIFAADEAQAERLLTERREPRPLGEDA